MPFLHLLGTGAGYSEPHRTTTMLAMSDGDNLVVIDCGGDVTQRILAAGLDPLTIRHFILTHSHPDHIAGFPLFLEKIWLAGRKEPLSFYGLHEALDQAQRTFASFDTSGWQGMPELNYHIIPDTNHAPVLSDACWEISSAPVVHSVPTLGFRIACKSSNSVVAYSCDTEPCQHVVELAKGADILVHEATGAFKSHSSAEQAAVIAREAGAKRLILVHLPANLDEEDLKSARDIFPATEWGYELGRYEV